MNLIDSLLENGTFSRAAKLNQGKKSTNFLGVVRQLLAGHKAPPSHQEGGSLQ